MPWITPDGSYYPGVGPVAEGSIQVPERPGDDYSWIGDEWVFSPKVPIGVPMRKAQILLQSKGYLDAVESAINGLTGEAGIRARIDWNASSSVLRHNTTTLMIAQLIGLTDQQVDEFFIEAAALPDE